MVAILRNIAMAQLMCLLRLQQVLIVTDCYHFDVRYPPKLADMESIHFICLFFRNKYSRACSSTGVEMRSIITVPMIAQGMDNLMGECNGIIAHPILENYHFLFLVGPPAPIGACIRIIDRW